MITKMFAVISYDQINSRIAELTITSNEILANNQYNRLTAIYGPSNVALNSASDEEIENDFGEEMTVEEFREFANAFSSVASNLAE